MILKIVKFDEEALRQETHEVSLPTTNGMKLIVSDMLQTMVSVRGLGLSAPQVSLPYRVFITCFDDNPNIFINPDIIERSTSKGTETEQCLSLPGVTVPVRRSKIIRINYYDASGKFFERKKFKGMYARIIQHEYDHIQKDVSRRLITDHLSTQDKRRATFHV